MRRFIERKLGVYMHEHAGVLRLALIFFSVFFSMAIFRNYVDATFLKRYDVGQIPLMLVVNGFVTFLVLGVLGRMGGRFPDHSLLTGFLMVSGLAVCGVIPAVGEGLSVAYPILFQLLHLQDTVFLVYLWNIANDSFDARQGKRIFPLITACQVLATALGNFCTQLVAGASGHDFTLPFYAASSFAVALLLTRAGTKEVHAAGGRNSATRAHMKRLSEIPSLIRKYPIVRYLVVVGLVPNILLPIFTYLFSVIADRTFASEQSLITFYAYFRGSMTLAVFCALLMMGRLYSKMGLANASLAQPINFALIFGALTCFFNIYAAALGQLLIRLVQQAVSGPATKTLFNMVPRDVAAWCRVFVRGTVVKTGLILGSLAMLILKPLMAPRYLAPIAACAGIYWVVEALLFCRRYKVGLKQVIMPGSVDFDKMDAALIASGESSGELESQDIGAAWMERPDKVEPLHEMTPEIALKLLEDGDESTRAEAAASFAKFRDPRAVLRLVRLLDDREMVRKAAVEALINHGEAFLPFLEAALIDSPTRIRRGILEVLRLSGLRGLDVLPFLGRQLTDAYNNLIAMQVLSRGHRSESAALLAAHLEEENREILSLVFHALWVNYADMRLMYEALRSAEASVAVEMIEESIPRHMAGYLVPIIDNIPVEEKIRLGRGVLPLMGAESIERALIHLASRPDPTTRLLAAFALGEHAPDPVYLPVAQMLLEDAEQDVRQTASYAMKRCMNEGAPMPDEIELIKQLKDFIIFDGMGIKELRAIASIVAPKAFRPGDVMIGEGESNSSIYLLTTGRVNVFRAYATAEEYLEATLGAGAFIGELRLFTELPSDTTCVAAAPTKALIIHKSHFHEIMKIYPTIGINLCLFFALKLVVQRMDQCKE